MSRINLAVAGLVVLTALSGCQTTETFKMPDWKMPKLDVKSMFNGESENEVETPVRMAVIWKDTTIADVGKPTTRGFGGRIYFYNEENEPIKADGELIVYGYDESQANNSTAADRKYVFNKEDLNSHYSETDLGPSYSVWIPWDRVGGMRKPIALLPMFKDHSGHLVRGGQSINVLPGTAPPEDTVAKVDDLNVIQISRPSDQAQSHHHALATSTTNKYAGQQVNHEVENTETSSLRTATFKVPRRLSNQIQRANSGGQAIVKQEPSESETDKKTDKPDTFKSPLMKKLEEANRQAGGNYAVKLGSQTESTQQESETVKTAKSPFSHNRPKGVFGQPGSFR